MGPLTGLKLSRISLLLLASSSILIPTQAANIFLRQNQQCGGQSGLSQCGSGFPSEFCCPTGTTCRALGTKVGASAICCPTGTDCSFIQPITCDITQLNATLHPGNQIHLKNTTVVELPKCGSQCCPLGYSCQNGMCAVDSTSSPSSPTSTASSVGTQAPVASQTATSNFPPVVHVQPGFDGKSFVAGFFPGMVVGALLTLAFIWLIKKRREIQEKKRYSGDFGHVSRTISDPIYDPMHAARTDFIRRGTVKSEHSSTTSTAGFVKKPATQPGGLTPKIKSMWERTPKLGFSNFGGHSLQTDTLPSNPRPPPPAVRAGNRDPYITPQRTPARTVSTRSRSTSIGTASIRHNKPHHHHRPVARRSESSETIDVLMPAPSESLQRPPSFLHPPRAPGMGNSNRYTHESTNTTFTKIMESVGYDQNTRNEVRNYKGTPGQAR
ncbi:hypothetical protein B0J11DRAFT_217126 [Dendryphion nanum]|uniref:Uncharacterized protein n=1 Tax=Dendryphion nanum TaxID=256645 RepID=A0A9P9ITS5_9PLEO|nr:hypothetical protein B0J11DRAFT_217126 [Dendryphion nanum]